MSGRRFVERLNERVKRGGVDFTTLAERTGIERRRLLRLARGETKHGPTLDEVRTLARELTVSPSWLAGAPS